MPDAFAGYPQAAKSGGGPADLPGTLGVMRRELPEEGRELLVLQHGILSRAQALDLGIGPRTVSSRLRHGHWQRLHRGVYATFTGQPDREATLWAALHRMGPDAMLSHWTAAELSKLATRPSTLIHVTIPQQRHLHAIPGIVIHRSRRADAIRHPSLIPPRTRIEETALDLVAASRSLDEALAWLARACGARLTTPVRLAAAMDGRTRLRWREALTAALDDVGGRCTLCPRTSLHQQGGAAAPAAPCSTPGPDHPRPAHRVQRHPVLGVRGGRGNGRSGRPPARGPLARPAPGQCGQR